MQSGSFLLLLQTESELQLDLNPTPTDRICPTPLLKTQVCACVCVYLVRVCVQVEVLQEASGKLTEQEVVGLVDRPEAPVRVVICTGAGTEWTHCNTHTHTHLDIIQQIPDHEEQYLA